MKIQRSITAAQTRRVQAMSLVFLGGITMELLTAYVADAKIEHQDYEGPYLWNGSEYKMFQRIKMPRGYVDEYSDKEEFCTSWVYNSGLSLMGDGVLGVLYLCFLFWLFVGIAILADIFMEAIEVITSKAEIIEVADENGSIIQVEKMVWNPTIANLTLMALGSSAPEIILSIADTMSTLGDLPSELGPQAIVGSAAFNLLVISAVSIVAVTEIKKIKMLGVFIATAIFSTWAYVWFFLVLVVISPGLIEMWEALTTLGFMVLLVVVAYSCDVSHSRKESRIEERLLTKRKTVKSALRILTKRFGIKAILQVGQGHTDDSRQELFMSEDDKANIQYYFTYLLDKDPKEATLDELLDCTQPENAVERIMYRREVGTNQKKDFVRLRRGEKGQAQHQKAVMKNPSHLLCFKHLKYEVSESNGHVTVTVEKKVNQEMTFLVRTVDGTAKAGRDYEACNLMLTMKADEREREVKIGIVDDPAWQPDEDFKVVLLDAVTKTQIPGEDTECTVTIHDADKPGNIGVVETILEVRRIDKVALIQLKRFDGSDGSISCTASTINDLESLPGKVSGLEGRDFVPFKDKEIVFAPGQVEYTIEVEMPECDETVIMEDQDDEDGPDTVSFAVQLSNPKPEGVKLSKRSKCIVNIEPTDYNEINREERERRLMLDYFLSEKEVSWAQQFKFACILGPQIDQDNLIVEDVDWKGALWHFFSMFWKVFGAIVPPRQIWGGWAAFIVALLLIGIVTTIVGEVASVLGCVIDLKPSVTGITLVALGTSLPDTFASMTAARTSDNADSAIGNVTGSNSVNVFLGMGLPWLIACSYWLSKDGSDYQVPPGSMSFSVVVFLCCSVVCFIVLGLRRYFLGGELGGTGMSRPITAVILVFLWLIYIILVSLESYGVLEVTIGDIPEYDV